MRTLAITVIVMLFASSVIADVAITAVDLGGQKIQINFTSTGGAVVRGIALKLTITGGNLANSSAYVPGSSSFNTFVDYAYSNAGYIIGVGHPLANPHAPGVPVFPATEVAISAGYLDMGGTQAGLTSGVVATLQLSGIGNFGNAAVAITADTLLRGGPVVGENLGNISIQSSLDMPCGPCDCLKSSAPYYAAWVSLGKPDCWCFKRNCRGDVNNLKSGPANYIWVNSADLTVFSGAYNKTESVLKTTVISGVYGICADNNRLKSGLRDFIWVNSADLTIFSTYYNKTEANTPICDQTNFYYWK